MDVNGDYIKSVICFLEEVLSSKEKKHSLMQAKLKTHWKSLVSADENIYLMKIKIYHDMDDFAFFNLLLALSLELSDKLKQVFKRLFETAYATPLLAQALYCDLHPARIQDILLVIQEDQWHLFYTSNFKQAEYLHNRLLLLQPWILSYCFYGGVMRCHYVSFMNIDKKIDMSSEQRTSFLLYAKQGMKAIVTQGDEILLLETLNTVNMIVCVVNLAYLPSSWNVNTLFSFCSFYAKMLSCAFFIRFDDESQEKYLKSIIKTFPYTFLITTQERLPFDIPTLPLPYDMDSKDGKSKNVFIKEYSFQKELPYFIGEDNFLKRLDEFVEMVKNKEEIHRVMDTNATMKGISALFYGPSGNGKTLCARYIAKRLKKRLWQIELSNVIDKYIGESEKHLEKIFNDAEKEDVILLFDEADTIFTKRTSVQEANDRYANAMTAYVLQRIESFSGIMILTSNFLHNFDDAFLRRIHCILRFYEANKEQRMNKWKGSTAHMDVAENMDWDEIANVKLSYARIDQCIFMACSFMISQKLTCLCENHIKKAIVYELEKHGEMPPKNWLTEFM